MLFSPLFLPEKLSKTLHYQKHYLRLCKLRESVVAVSFKFLLFSELASWLNWKALVFGMGGLRFKSLAREIGHSVANGLHRRNVLREELCCLQP